MQHETPANTEFPEVTPEVNPGVANPAVDISVPKTAAQLEALRARRETLEAQRLRLLHLQQIEDEQAQLDQQISQLEKGSTG